VLETSLIAVGDVNINRARRTASTAPASSAGVVSAPQKKQGAGNRLDLERHRHQSFCAAGIIC
jgi:hypothetical protein